ncbi:MAG: HlyD family efflux transporter periplasmic adaptor subunit, partial [Gammaproteobacteria bacterium]|nr:HlyD family efflux transporter periplasmic adaptor subunit [Gammaproteobacteria bacterium]
HWHRVSNLQPALRQHLTVQHQIYRGQSWFLIQDPTTGRHHRFSAAAQEFIGRMDGRRSVQRIWDELNQGDTPNGITQDSIMQLLSQLHAADLLNTAVTPDMAELMQRGQRRKRRNQLSRYMNPLALRFALLDPDEFLTRTMPRLRSMFTRGALVAWLVVVTTAAVLAGMHWGELTVNLSDRILTPGNLLLIWLIYPFIKALHELGHGYATKHWGGEVHEMGIMLLVFTPVPYVDASSSAAFADKHARMLVGAAGILVELFIAAVAMLIWAAAEPGLLRAVAFNVMLIGAVSTVLVNGNPLLRFDGYYVLADAVEIPNLGTRANRYIGFLVRRYLFGFSGTTSPAQTASEAWILGTYAIAAFAYRIFIMCVIVLFVASEFFVAGTLLAIYAVIMQLLVPAWRHVKAFLDSNDFNERPAHNRLRGGLLVTALAALITMLPLPLSTQAEGVVWLPPDSEVRAGVDATVAEIIATPGAQVKAGQLLIRLEDPQLAAEITILRAEQTEALARFQAERNTDPVEAQILQEDVTRAAGDLAAAEERFAALTIHAKRNGEFIIDDPDSAPGRFVRNGELLAFVAENAENTVLVAVHQDEIGLIRARTQAVALRLAEKLGSEIPATIVRATPAATNRLPSAALSSAGGGRFAADPGDPEGLSTLDAVFQLELATDGVAQRFGERAYVRFEHGYEPLAMQVYRHVRQTFLSRLNT